MPDQPDLPPLDEGPLAFLLDGRAGGAVGPRPETAAGGPVSSLTQYCLVLRDGHHTSPQDWSWMLQLTAWYRDLGVLDRLSHVERVDQPPKGTTDG